ncbi:MAG: asparagine synthase-related protein, partial [Brevefilum sp.]|nr:asparagine synthase-related protein [Brevefilum sp.]
MMSGGLDSASVAAVAAPLLKKCAENLTAFTEVPDIDFDEPMIKGRYADETPYVQAIAAMYDNLDLNLIRTDDQVYLDGLDNFFFASEV